MAKVKTFILTIWADEESDAHTITFRGISRIAACRYIDYYLKDPNYLTWSTVENY
jgi:hypothetical protein